GRAHGRLRCHRHQPGRPSAGAVPWPFVPHQGADRRHAARGLKPFLQRHTYYDKAASRRTAFQETDSMSNSVSKPGLDPIEHASRDEIEALQLQRLKWTLAHAYQNVPHYRRAFDAAGVHPDDLKQLSDIAKFPFTTKQDLRENYPFGMFAVPREQVARVHASSGTTGKPTVVGYTARDIDNWAALVARSIRAAGGKP